MTWTLTKRTWFYKDPDFPAAIDSKSNWFNWFLTTFLATKGWTTEVVPDGNDTWYGLKKTVTDASGKEVNLAYSIEIEPNSSDITYGLWVDPSSPPSSGNQVIHYSESTNLILNSNTKGMEVWESDETYIDNIQFWAEWGLGSDDKYDEKYVEKYSLGALGSEK